MQPLDAGIIKNFKCLYRKLLIKHVIANIDSDSSTTASDIAQTINLLKAIEWVKQAWDRVESSTVINCFASCSVVSADDNETEDPFGELDEHINITELNSLVQYVCPNSTVTEYLDADQDLSVSFTIDPEEMETEQWRDRLRQEALAMCRNEACSEDEESYNELEITEVEENCITTTRQAMKCVEICKASLQKMKTSSQ